MGAHGKMINISMKHVNAYPFVGKDYQKGFLNSGRKVLILGHSHYNVDAVGEPCEHDFTKVIVGGFFNGEAAQYHRGFTSQTKALYNKDINAEERQEVWRQVAFYNFIQFYMDGFLG